MGVNFSRFFVFHRIAEKVLIRLKKKNLSVSLIRFSDWKPLMQDFYRKVINQFTGLLTAIANLKLIQKFKNRSLIMMFCVLITELYFFRELQ